MLPRELWHEIFQLATFIPGELVIYTTMIRPGLFGTCDELQPLAWKKLLPLRVAIQGVSRLWHSIGVELLYRAFHDTDNSHMKVKLFARTLCIKPSYAVLVKRLTLQLTKGVTINAGGISILRSCSKLLILSTEFWTYKPEMGWDGYLLPTSLRHFDAAVGALPLSNLLAALAQLPNLELLALYEINEEEDPPPPAPARSVVLPRLRLLRLACGVIDQDDTPIIERILSSLSLPRLTALSLEMSETSPAPSLCKELLSRLTYFQLEEFHQGTILGSLQATDLPCLHIFHHDISSRGTLLSNCPNLPIQQINILIVHLISLDLDRFPQLDKFSQWRSSLHCVLTEARDSKLMPKLKCVILEGNYDMFYEFYQFHLTYDDLVSCFNPLADAFESRGVEFLLRTYDTLEGDIPIRDFVVQMKSPCLSSSSCDLVM
jgi:hypothetical protein